MRLFMADGGKTGFTLKGYDIVNSGVSGPSRAPARGVTPPGLLAGACCDYTELHRRFRTTCGRFTNAAKRSAQKQPLVPAVPVQGLSSFWSRYEQSR